MMFILTEEEYNSLVAREEHEKVVDSLKKVISEDNDIIFKLQEEILKDRACYKKGSEAYCDGCPLGFENLGICRGGTNYSK